MKMIYLLSTDHFEDSLWFRDEEDFKVAMNYVAIQAVCSPDVVVLAFILMSNHVHFVLLGTRRRSLLSDSGTGIQCTCGVSMGSRNS